MLRQVARVARWLLAILGLACLLWLPVSFFLAASARVVLPELVIGLVINRGYFKLARSDPAVEGTGSWVGLFSTDRPSEFPIDWTLATWPQYDVITYNVGYRAYVLRLPLWLLAFLCLAWPVNRTKHRLKTRP